jgi:hypothetical protein
MPDVSMRSERVEGELARRYFSPAIFSEPGEIGCVSYRQPRWYAVRLGQINERLMLTLLDLIDLQPNRVPGIIEVLGSPTPLEEGVVEDLVERLPRRLPRNGADVALAVGTEVRITSGMFQSHVGKVIRSDRRYVTVLWMMFGHLREQTLRTVDVEVVG